MLLEFVVANCCILPRKSKSARTELSHNVYVFFLRPSVVKASGAIPTKKSKAAASVFTTSLSFWSRAGTSRPGFSSPCGTPFYEACRGEKMNAATEFFQWALNIRTTISCSQWGHKAGMCSFLSDLQTCSPFLKNANTCICLVVFLAFITTVNLEGRKERWTFDMIVFVRFGITQGQMNPLLQWCATCQPGFCRRRPLWRKWIEWFLKKWKIWTWKSWN